MRWPFRNAWLFVCRTEGVGSHASRDDRFGLFKTIAKSAAKNFVGDHQFIAAHFVVRLKFLRINVDELHDPIAVGAAGGSKEMRDDVAGDGDVFRKRIGFPRQSVWAMLDETLVFDEPGVPTASF